MPRADDEYRIEDVSGQDFRPSSYSIAMCAFFSYGQKFWSSGDEKSEPFHSNIQVTYKSNLL